MLKSYLIRYKVWLILFLVAVMATIITYSNHFHNDFHFDDNHTIVNNIYIRDLSNWKSFFKDGQTMSSLPANSSYRPLFTASVALDYWISENFSADKNGLDPLFFHLSNFIFFLIQGVFMYFMFFKILDISYKHSWNKFVALFAVGWYWLHPGNAETINYICARSDSYSTLGVVIGMVLYQFMPQLRKYGLYLLPVIVGALVKPTAIMFAPMLFTYILLFEQKDAIVNMLLDLVSKNSLKSSFFKSLVYSLPALAVCFLLYLFINQMTPDAMDYSGHSDSEYKWKYLMTQPFVVLRYFTTFFLPFDLSADTDLKIFEKFNLKVLGGILFVLFLFATSIVTSAKQKLRPISFGILWFFFALIPTSSIIPLAEVMNDHRMFFPYVGLVLVVTWTLALIIYHFQNRIILQPEFKWMVATGLIGVLSINAYGTYQRNKVWHTAESLWHDVTVKSPKNGRGLMNYGLALMKKGDLEGALSYFEKALDYTPYYSYLHINLGIVKNALNKKEEAEYHYKYAISNCTPKYHGSYYYYGKWLLQEKRLNEAKQMLESAIKIYNDYMDARYLLMQIYSELGDYGNLRKLCNTTLKIVSNDPIALNYQKIAFSGKSKLELALLDVKKKPTLENLIRLSKEFANEKKYNESAKILEEVTKLSPTTDNYIDLSLQYYYAGKYNKTIEACKKVIAIDQNNAIAYNNICSAYNALKQWEKGIEACEKALEIDPEFELAGNNLKWAKKNLNK